MPWPKTKLATTATAMLTPNVMRMNLVACLPASGMKRMSALIRLSCARPARNIMAEIVAALSPTASAE
ncbi:MAG: hypothetical protein E6J28_14725 [Chloroflexi bacterium]|nr:MAG: hypothetical protein E6J28_14725 [Chloroflexota bacterium]